MTRKDFVLIAAVLKDERSRIAAKDASPERDAQLRAIDNVAIDMSAALKTTNPNFDRGRFLLACDTLL